MLITMMHEWMDRRIIFAMEILKIPLFLLERNGSFWTTVMFLAGWPLKTN